MHPRTAKIILTLAASLVTLTAVAQTSLTRVDQLVGTGASLVAGDLTFSNFTLPPLPIAASPPLDGVGDIAASAVVNDNGTVSLSFIAIDPATGAALPIVGAALKCIAYDVTVTNPDRLLSSVNQSVGPATTAVFNILTYRPPAPSPFKGQSGILGAITTDDTLIFDNTSNAFEAGGKRHTFRQGSLLDRSCQTYFASDVGDAGGCDSPLPGGFRSGLGLHNFFGVVLDRHSFIYNVGFPSNVFDSITTTFTLVPATTAPVLIPVALAGIDVSQPGIVRVSLARTVGADGQSHPGYAPAGGLPVTLTTSDASALPLPSQITMPQGSSTTTVALGDNSIDLPTTVTATASYDGVTVQQTATVTPTVPLTFFLGGNFGQGGALLGISLNRINFSPAVFTLTSSLPAVGPVPATLTIAPLTQSTGTIPVTFQPVPTDTVITFTAVLNGVSQARSFTIPRTVDSVTLSKAELTVKNGALKVEAVGNVPAAVLTLSNATTGQRIGTMTNLGKGKYSFQGTVSPVVSLRLSSSFSGSTTGAVAQK